MIEKVGLENFKGIKKAEIELGDITVLIGPNGTGKSSIIQALMVMRQSMNQRVLQPTGELIELGAFNDILNRDAKVKHIGISASVKLKKYEYLNIPDGTSYSFDSFWHPQLYELDARIGSPNQKCLRFYGSNSEGYKLEPEILEPKKLDIPGVGIKFSGNKNSFPKSISVASKQIPRDYLAIAQIKELVNKCEEEANDIVDTLPNALNDIYYIPATRGIEKKTYALSAGYIVDVISGDNTQLASTFAYADSQIKEMVEIWTREITGSGIQANLIPNKQVLIESDVADGIPVITDGSGVNQLVHLLLMFGIVPNGSTLGIEEPEIHLHPKAQKKLCSLLVELTRKVYKRQLIITTHSQNIMFAFLNEVKDGNMDRNELKIYYFEDKEKEPKRVEIDEGGDIYEWGKNFFDYT